MSIAIMSRIFKLPLGGSGRKILALRLADFADDEGKGIWPTIGRLSVETELSERTVQRTIREFVDEGLLIVVAEASGRPGQANRYDLDLNTLSRLEAEAKAKKATGDIMTPVETGDIGAETGDTSDVDGCHHGTRTVIEPLSEPSLRESVRDVGEEGDQLSNPAGESPSAIERSFRKFFRDWPTMVSDSEPEARREWGRLTSEERKLAADRAGAFGEASKQTGRKYTCSAAVYLREKRWEKLPETKFSPAIPKLAAPFGKAWSAARLAELCRDRAPLPPMPKMLLAAIDEGHPKSEQWRREHAQRYGWPKVSEMHDKAARGEGIMVPERLAQAGSGFAQVRRGGDVEAAWLRFHERCGWPWLPDSGRHEWVYFPALDDGDDLDRSVAQAFHRFMEAFGRGRDAAA